MIYFISLGIVIKMITYLAQKNKVTSLSIKKLYNVVLGKYLDITRIYLKKLSIKLAKHFGINKYRINIKERKQILYRLI